MKNKLFLFILCITIQGCFYMNGEDDFVDPPVFGNYEPVIMNRTEFESTTSYESTPRPIENSGKIYVKGNYIFINEVNKGFHIIDNSNPTNPNSIGFINILGSSDLSVKSDVYYVNNARDLIAFKIEESQDTLLITKRIKNVFPQIWSPEGPVFYDVEEDEIIVDWTLIE